MQVMANHRVSLDRFAFAFDRSNDAKAKSPTVDRASISGSTLHPLKQTLLCKLIDSIIATRLTNKTAHYPTYY